MKGVVFDIKRFAVHDGPGIRTTVFLKGCPMHCPWCQNPEGRDLERRLWHFPDRCIHCGRCIEACPEGALSHAEAPADPIVIDHERCTCCGSCVHVCPARATAFDGWEMSSDLVVREVLKDRVFYDRSGGGLTLSGGDPLVQHAFSLDILRRAKGHGLHTVVETCLAGESDVLRQFTPLTDLFLVDLKLADAVTHERLTGQSLDLVRENFEYLLHESVDLIVRIPMIPGATAIEENLEALGAYLHETAPDTGVELINFNPLARSKYRRMNRPYGFDAFAEPYDADAMQRFRDVIASRGANVILQ